MFSSIIKVTLMPILLAVAEVVAVLASLGGGVADDFPGVLVYFVSMYSVFCSLSLCLLYALDSSSWVSAKNTVQLF